MRGMWELTKVVSPFFSLDAFPLAKVSSSIAYK